MYIYLNEYCAHCKNRCIRGQFKCSSCMAKFVNFNFYIPLDKYRNLVTYQMDTKHFLMIYKYLESYLWIPSKIFYLHFHTSSTVDTKIFIFVVSPPLDVSLSKLNYFLASRRCRSIFLLFSVLQSKTLTTSNLFPCSSLNIIKYDNHVK